MKEFRTKKLNVKLICACVSPEYFAEHFSDYYDLFVCDIFKSKVHGVYFKFFYKLKPAVSSVFADMDEDSYYQLPPYVCKSTIY